MNNFPIFVLALGSWLLIQINYHLPVITFLQSNENMRTFKYLFLQHDENNSLQYFYNLFYRTGRERDCADASAN